MTATLLASPLVSTPFLLENWSPPGLPPVLAGVQMGHFTKDATGAYKYTVGVGRGRHHRWHHILVKKSEAFRTMPEELDKLFRITGQAVGDTSWWATFVEEKEATTAA